eukprot:1516515-Pyramimonas_sp.AAC.2
MFTRRGYSRMRIRCKLRCAGLLTALAAAGGGADKALFKEAAQKATHALTKQLVDAKRKLTQAEELELSKEATTSALSHLLAGRPSTT